MIWLEMSRDEIHGGGDWSFSKCLWSPSQRKNYAKWPYWETLLQTNVDDIIFHLRGKGKGAKFVGYSFVETKGYETTDRPPHPGEWDFSDSFYKVPLRNYTIFEHQISLINVFQEKELVLRKYFEANKTSKTNKKLLFYVIQNNQIRCQNGAYLTEFDEPLLNIIFDFNRTIYDSSPSQKLVKEVNTSESITNIKSRVGQKLFADKVKLNFNYSCCFPDCDVNDSRFLIGSHIARWIDFPELRGDVTNGLCFCLIHDKAFESGIFSIDDNYKIVVNRSKLLNEWTKEMFLGKEGETIKKPQIDISVESLKKHWERIKLNIAN